jgi:exonuclease SbcD
LRSALPHPDQLKGAIVRLSLEYPREWEPSIDESVLKEHRAAAFEFHLVRRPLMQTRIRIPEDHPIGSLTSLELLDLYWRAMHTEESESQELNRLAVEIVEDNQDGRDSL